MVLKLMLKEKTERRAFLREYCIALCLSSHTACLRALPVAFESATHFAFGQELAPAGDLCALLNPGVRAAPGLCGSGVGARRGGRREEKVPGQLCSGCSDAVCGETLCSRVHGHAFCRGRSAVGAVMVCAGRPFAVSTHSCSVGRPFAMGCMSTPCMGGDPLQRMQ